MHISNSAKDAASSDVAPTYMKLMEFAASRGAHAIDTLTGCWEAAVDEHWWVAINGHNEPARCSNGAAVPALGAYVEHDGWPAGEIGAGIGYMVTRCSWDVNEHAFLKALGAAIGRR